MSAVDLILALAIVFSIATFAGMVRPWYVLWWMSHQNRMKVLTYYGLPSLLLWVLWFLAAG